MSIFQKYNGYNYWWVSKGDGDNQWMFKELIFQWKRVRCGWHLVDRGWGINLRCMIGCTEKSANHNDIEWKEQCSFGYIHRRKED